MKTPYFNSYILYLGKISYISLTLQTRTKRSTINVFDLHQMKAIWLKNWMLLYSNRSQDERVSFSKTNVSWMVWKEDWMIELCHSVTFQLHFSVLNGTISSCGITAQIENDKSISIRKCKIDIISSLLHNQTFWYVNDPFSCKTRHKHSGKNDFHLQIFIPTSKD